MKLFNSKHSSIVCKGGILLAATLLLLASCKSAPQVESVAEQIRKMKVPNVSVREDERGIVISLDNFQFPADSAELLDEEKAKLEKLTVIFNKYPDIDLLISGHTAKGPVGIDPTPLSEERAANVKQFYVELGVRSANHIAVKGYGDT